MDIRDRNSNLYFNAKLLRNVKIQEFNDSAKKYINKSASVVELEPKNRNDYKAINVAVNNWNNDSFGSNIAGSFNRLVMNQNEDKSTHILALTTQNKDYGSLKPDLIQGLMEIYEGQAVTDVFYLQVNPDIVYASESPKYKHVGKSLVTTLQDICDNKEILLYSKESAMPFYKKLGFNYVNGITYSWKKKQ
mgnify:CR=1 FL=1